MSIFDLFKKKKNNVSVKFEIDTTPKYIPTSPIHTPRHDARYDTLVLWWISKKKKGYDITTNKFPKWFINNYGIPFNDVALDYVKRGFINNENNLLTITDAGNIELKDKDYVIYAYQKSLDLNLFINNPNLHKVKNEDIAWGYYNQRIMELTKRGMWKELDLNYSSMCSLLLDEKRYNDALEYVFACAFLQVSGMIDNNKLTPIYTDIITKKPKYHPNGMVNVFLLDIYVGSVVKPFKTIQKQLNLDNNEIKERYFKSQLVNGLYNILPFHYFEKEEAFEIFRQATVKMFNENGGIFNLAQLDKPLKYNKPNPNSKAYFYNSTDNQLK